MKIRQEQIPSILVTLHWLPIERHILFKLATLTFKSLHCDQPSYLSVLLERFIPAQALRSSSDATRLAVPRSKTKFGSRAFRIVSPTVCNSLQVYIRTQPNLSSFRRHLKTFISVSHYHSVVLSTCAFDSLFVYGDFCA